MNAKTLTAVWAALIVLTVVAFSLLYRTLMIRYEEEHISIGEAIVVTIETLTTVGYAADIQTIDATATRTLVTAMEVWGLVLVLLTFGMILIWAVRLDHLLRRGSN